MTRQSELAMVQANAVAAALRKLNPGTQVDVISMQSEADQVLQHPLAKFGGKGLFTNRLEQALLKQQADLAVHCVKDMPTDHTSGLIIAAVPKRADTRDTLISRYESLSALPAGARFGTASPRRAAQVLKLRPDLQIGLLRGNVQTRYDAVMVEKRFDATLLALAGLQRLNMPEFETLKSKAFSLNDLPPAPGQGALALQCRADDHITMRRCFPINDSASSTLVNIERNIVNQLNGDCHSPIAAHASFEGLGQVSVRVCVYKTDGSEVIDIQDNESIRHIGRLCDRMTQTLIERGANELLQLASDDAKHA